jgi:UDP-2,4-diacetamido-2,4,6-trideoxy-beta-L-altropyranose hydrolase
MGFGHITRCISLYQAFQKIYILPFFIINGDKTVKDLLVNKKHKIFNWLTEVEKVLKYIESAEIIIIDSYLAGYEIYEKISRLVKVPVYIDDNKRIDYPKGIVVNGTVYADELNYPARKEVNYLLGTQFIPVRKAFWDVPDKEIKENIATIMVTFGGDDSRNMTPPILKLLNENFPKLTKKVILGRGFRNTEQIESFKDEKTELIYFPYAEGMKKTMLESDVAISASGQTLYELARVGVPTIAISVADNQLNNIKGCQKAGFIEYAGAWDNKDILNLLMQKFELLRNADVRNKMARAGRSWVDGFGAKRTVNFCLKNYFENYLSLRKAEKKDIYSIYELSNDTDVRQNSFNTDKIEIENHITWFTNKIVDKNCLFLIAEIKCNFVGKVRFDINGDAAVVSISLIRRFRGLGAGRILLQKAMDFLRSAMPYVLFVRAYIKKENIHSKRLFEIAGFLFVKESTIKGHDAFEYLYQFHYE